MVWTRGMQIKFKRFREFGTRKGRFASLRWQLSHFSENVCHPFKNPYSHMFLNTFTHTHTRMWNLVKQLSMQPHQRRFFRNFACRNAFLATAFTSKKGAKPRHHTSHISSNIVFCHDCTLHIRALCGTILWWHRRRCFRIFFFFILYVFIESSVFADVAAVYPVSQSNVACTKV